MFRTAVIAIAAIVATTAATPAFADTDREGRPIRIVRIADLDLSKPADQEKMVQRVERAARRICSVESTRIERRKCAAETVEYTLNLVSPTVREAYAAATDRRESYALASN
jgi:UrcA family protein